MRISDWSSDVCSSDLKNQEHHLKRWHEIGKVKFLHEEDLTKMGVKVTYAGMRSRYPEQDKATREALLTEEEGWKAGGKKSVTKDVFGKASSSAPEDELEAIEIGKAAGVGRGGWKVTNGVVEADA